MSMAHLFSTIKGNSPQVPHTILKAINDFYDLQKLTGQEWLPEKLEGYDIIKIKEMIENLSSDKEDSSGKELLAIGYLHSLMNDWPQALQYYQKINPSEIASEEIEKYYLLYGWAQLETKQYKAAQEVFDECVRVNRDNIFGYYYRSLAWYKLEEYDKTAQDCEEAQRIYPGFIPAWHRAGLAKMKQHDYGQAGHYLSLGIHLSKEISEHNIKLYAQEAARQARICDYQKAVWKFTEVINFASTATIAPALLHKLHYHRAWARVKIKQYPEAIFDLQECIRLDETQKEHLEKKILHIQKIKAHTSKKRNESVLTPETVFVRGGKFRMGENSESKDAAPTHTVWLDSFHIGKYPVQVAEYLEFCHSTQQTMPPQPNWSTDQHPVVNITYQDAKDYAAWLSNATSDMYSLPTEAQWEYAARGHETNSSRYAGCFHNHCKLTDVAWYTKNAGQQAHQVGTRLPNALDLYDMSGNVWEWCMDVYQADYYTVCEQKGVVDNPCQQVYFEAAISRVVRGGAWNHRYDCCHVAYRGHCLQHQCNTATGFRIVKVLGHLFSPK